MRHLIGYLVIVCALAAPVCRADGDLLEQFALAEDRAEVLKELIPGTEEYYFYHCLHYQNTGRLDEVEKLLDDSIAAEGYVIREPSASYGTDHLVDLSKIDFEALKAKFEKGRKRTEAEKLKGEISSKLKKMVRLNRTRMDYLERFQRMIDNYNAGSMNIDEFFKRLISFAQGLNEEEKRSITEQLTEEELAIFDLLTRPEISLTKKEEQQVKKVGRELIEILKREKLVLDWRKRQQSRAQVRVTIEDIFDHGLPQAYTPGLYQKKCDAVYQHIYESYYGAGKSVYAFAA